MYSDGHCHLPLSHDPEADLKRAYEAGISAFVMGGIHLKDWQVQIELAQKYRPLGMTFFLSFGLHPWFINENAEAEFTALKKMTTLCDAIGETGLDYYRAKSEEQRQAQKELFKRHLALAQEHQKPLVLHAVKSHGDCIKLLSQEGSSWKGMVHSFAGSWQEAEQYLNLGFHLSIGPNILRGYRKETLAKIPEDRLIIESDAPQFNKPTQSSTNSLDIFPIAQKLADIRASTSQRLLKSSKDNIQAIFTNLNAKANQGPLGPIHEIDK